MTLTEVTDIHLPELTVYHQIRDNTFIDKSFVADSPKVVNLLLETDIIVHSILATQEYYDEHSPRFESRDIKNLFVASKTLMQTIVGHKVHHNCMMHAQRPQQTNLDALDDEIIMLDEISSTENIGSIARSAAALGVNSYLLPKQGPHPYNRRSLRVSMGHMALLKTHLYDDIKGTIKSLQSLGYKVFAAEVNADAIKLQAINVPEKWVIVMGHEGKGLSQDVVELCDTCVMIEMAEGIKSFNVAVAASLMMYTFIQKL